MTYYILTLLAEIVVIAPYLGFCRTVQNLERKFNFKKHLVWIFSNALRYEIEQCLFEVKPGGLNL